MDFTGKTIDFDGPKIEPNGEDWILTKEYTVRIGAKINLVCPKGMPTDGASIPRFFWRLIGHPMKLPALKAAVIHDGAYKGELAWKYDGVADDYTRKEADMLFRELLKALHVSWWRRSMMYQAVRWFGGGSWLAR